jgi:putative tryptophan/tyrosine transport system substrate-binding protein
MRRRDFITLFGVIAAAGPRAARAQGPDRMRRIGVMVSTGAEDGETKARVAALQNALGEFGWKEGSNIRLDVRGVGGDAGRAKAYAAELIALAPDVIVGGSTLVLATLQSATRTIPIVFVGVGDPVGQGFVSSLARPGGNITGFTAFEFAISGKWLEILKEIAPSTTRVTFIYNPEVEPFGTNFLQTIQDAAPAFAIESIAGTVRNTSEIEQTIAAAAHTPYGGLIVSPGAFTTANRGLIVSLAARHRLPAVYAYRFYAADGGLVSYGHDLTDGYRQAASYVDRILRGARPSDLPVEQPTRYELVVNVKTAKALGFEVPATLLARADEVIE